MCILNVADASGSTSAAGGVPSTTYPSGVRARSSATSKRRASPSSLASAFSASSSVSGVTSMGER